MILLSHVARVAEVERIGLCSAPTQMLHTLSTPRAGSASRLKFSVEGFESGARHVYPALGRRVVGGFRGVCEPTFSTA